MRRWQIKGLLALILPSLLFFVTCGIPYFINLDSAISFSRTSGDENSFQGDISISDLGIEKIDELHAQPALKFFYSLSTNNTTNSPPSNNNDINAESYNLSRIPSAFNSYYKGSQGNGVIWARESKESAPGFYLYTKENNSVRNFARFRRSISNLNKEPSGLLVGTFAHCETEDGDYSFGSAPEMDILLDFDSGKFAWKIEKQAVDGGFILKMTYGEDNTLLYLKNYNNHPFRDKANLELFVEEDPYFNTYIASEADSSNLYLHIWVSLYGGAGDFTNVYWSPLYYAGNIKLF